MILIQVLFRIDGCIRFHNLDTNGSRSAVWRIRISLIRIRIQDVKKFVTDPDPGRTLIRIWSQILAKTIRIL